MPNPPARPDDPIDEELRDARKAAGLTQIEAAALVGVDPQTISRWERRETTPSKGERWHLLEAYSASVGGRTSPRQNVPRGTAAVRKQAAHEPRAPYNARADRIQAFEREMVRLGADDFEADHVRERARAFVEAIHSQGGTDVDEELELYLEASLKPWVVAHMKRRGAKPKEPK